MAKINLVRLLPLIFLISAGSTDRGAASFPDRIGPEVRLVENAGQYPDPVLYTLPIDGAKAWLTGEAVWLTYTDQTGAETSGTHLRLDFGELLVWEPLGPAGGDLCLITDGPEGARTLHPHTWAGARAELPDGAVLMVSGKGIAITGGARAAAALTIEGGSPAIRMEGSAGVIRADGRTLPLYWDIPLSVNGLPAGDRGGTAPDADPLGDDPQLLFGSYIGGENWDEGQTIARDTAGNLYIAGQSLSIFFPTAPGAFTDPQHNVEAFVARMNWLGTSLDYICVIRADVEDWGTALAVDAAGNAFLFGRTDSITNFPVTPGAYDTTPNGGFDLFLIKFNAAGDLVFSTLLGGGEDEFAGDLALQPDGSIVLTGSTASDGISSAVFPTTAEAYKTTHSGGRDIFIARMNPSGSELLYGTLIGGSENDHAEALALNGTAIVIGGWTASPDFDVPSGGYDTVLAGTFDGLVLSLTPGSADLDFWTFLGGLAEGLTGDRVLAIDVDAGGDVFASGSTYADDFPATPGSFDPTYDDSCVCSDGFVAKLASSGSSLLWATFLGGEGEDSIEALVLDKGGDLILAGATTSTGFPVSPDAFDDQLADGSDAIIARLAGSGTALPYSSYLGGSVEETGRGVAVTDGGWLLTTGWSNSPDFPTTPGAYDPEHNFDRDVFVVVLIPPGAEPLVRLLLPVLVR